MTFEELCENSFNDYQKATSPLWTPDTGTSLAENRPATWIYVSEEQRSLWRKHIENVLKNSGMQEGDLKEFKKSKSPKESLYIVEVFDLDTESWIDTWGADSVAAKLLPVSLEKAIEALKCATRAYPKSQYRISPVEAPSKSV